MSEKKSTTVTPFWQLYAALPKEIQKLADKQFDLFLLNPNHPSLGFKRKGNIYTAEVGRSYRAVARKRGDTYYWFWIGSHEEYNKLLRRVM